MPFEIKVISERRIAIDGFLYSRSRQAGGKTYWDCKKLRDRECKARAVTRLIDGVVTVEKGPDQSRHSHPPSREEVEAERIKHVILGRANEPHAPPSAILQGTLPSNKKVNIVLLLY